ncbi:hypothetical protein [Streptomyces scabiei]|uniref:hypothetical protein n=1 Tax=Streptomyces scabiei TaxID=1930 RepID=UPI0029ACE902|nr:hypothetical protein [Streptomyces scabiei]MDX3197857.1 hypothetical protein [Streptomyces scabiei]MDX3217692.1 hypothetical protein [Streptomyces scabiei]
MSTRDTETLADLVGEIAGKGPGRGAKLTFEQLSEKSVDPETGYRPSPNHLWRIAAGHDIKVNPPLVRAIAAGLEHPLVRVRAAAARQFLGWEAGGLPGADAEQDEVLRVARAAGVTSDDMPEVRAFFDELRSKRDGEK